MVSNITRHGGAKAPRALRNRLAGESFGFAGDGRAIPFGIAPLVGEPKDSAAAARDSVPESCSQLRVGLRPKLTRRRVAPFLGPRS
jgi:hypothetical protein